MGVFDNFHVDRNHFVCVGNRGLFSRILDNDGHDLEEKMRVSYSLSQNERRKKGQRRHVSWSLKAKNEEENGQNDKSQKQQFMVNLHFPSEKVDFFDIVSKR